MERRTEVREINRDEMESVALGLWSLVKSFKATANNVLASIGIALSSISIIMFLKL